MTQVVARKIAQKVEFEIFFDHSYPEKKKLITKIITQDLLRTELEPSWQKKEERRHQQQQQQQEASQA